MQKNVKFCLLFAINCDLFLIFAFQNPPYILIKVEKRGCNIAPILMLKLFVRTLMLQKKVNHLLK